MLFVIGVWVGCYYQVGLGVIFSEVSGGRYMINGNWCLEV